MTKKNLSRLRERVGRAQQTAELSARNVRSQEARSLLQIIYINLSRLRERVGRAQQTAKLSARNVHSQEAPSLL